MTNDEKSALLEICIRYDAAPSMGFQTKVGFVGTFVAPLGGDAGVGAEVVCTMVVKPHTFDQLLVPPPFVALTRQKYTALFASPLTENEVPAIPLWSTKVVVKVKVVDTCTRYDAAPLEAFQISVGLVDTPFALLNGEICIGTDGGAIAVVKLCTGQ
jgi:hypothetical protein